MTHVEHHAGHRHSHVDAALETDERGVRAVKISLLALIITALLQSVAVVLTGSVALLGDTVHNFADALTALPLWLAFNLGRRGRTRRYTYGYGKAEDIAGIFIVLAIAASASVAAYQSIQRFFYPQEVRSLGVVIVASLIGFVGNELVAAYRIRVGRAIGSAALVADGFHSRIDGLTSLTVLVGAAVVAAGYPLADPIVGLLITAAIVFILKNAARDVFYRLMDAVDPALVDEVEHVVQGVQGVERVDDVRLRWIGHHLRADVEITVDSALTSVEAHQIAMRAHHALLHEVARLSSAIVHVNPLSEGTVDHHAEIAHHFQGTGR